MLQQEGPDGIHCHAEGLILRIAEDAGRNERERHGLAAVLLRQQEARLVAGDELFPLAMPAAAPDRADGVDDVPAGQPIGPVSFASPIRQPPSLRHSASSSGPAARWMQPSTPPPPSKLSFAALTMASTGIFVMSLRMKCRGMVSPLSRSSNYLYLTIFRSKGKEPPVPSRLFRTICSCTLLARLLQ